jgi:hypothetical protein
MYTRCQRQPICLHSSNLRFASQQIVNWHSMPGIPARNRSLKGPQPLYSGYKTATLEAFRGVVTRAGSWTSVTGGRRIQSFAGRNARPVLRSEGRIGSCPA